MNIRNLSLNLSGTIAIAMPIEARYWRILCEEGGAGGFYGIGEIKMRETVGGPDITTEAQAIAGSEVSGREAAKAFDNDTTLLSAWATQTSQGVNAWLGQDFGVPRSIAEITITARTSPNQAQAPTGFRVQYSSDQAVWIDALVVTGEPAWGGSETRPYEL